MQRNCMKMITLKIFPIVCIIVFILMSCCSTDTSILEDNNLKVLRPVDVMQNLSPCELSVAEHFEKSNYVPPKKKSEGYTVQTPEVLASLKLSIFSMLEGDFTSAILKAEKAGYSLCKDAIESSSLILWTTKTSGDGKALIAMRTENALPLILGSPHNIFDGTVTEAWDIFWETKARVLIFAGTHRCANSNKSGCSGTTTSCGERAEYVESDMAHMTQTFYQKAHEVYADFYPNDWVLSLHGMKREGISLSDGTGLDLEDNSPTALLFNSFKRIFSEENITSCNMFNGATFDEHLCGKTNTQGRYVNGEEEVCTKNAMRSTNRFVHIEQNSFIRKSPNKVSLAIVNAVLSKGKK